MKKKRQKQQMEKIAYSAKEVAQALCCDIRTIRKGIADGNIPSIRLGTKIIRIPAHYLKQHRDGASSS